MSKYQDVLNKIVENSCPRRTNCQSCGISNTCNCLMKDEVDTLQELIDKATPKPTVMINNGFVCPTCGDDIKVKLLYAHYCNECGQRLE